MITTAASSQIINTLIISGMSAMMFLVAVSFILSLANDTFSKDSATVFKITAVVTIVIFLGYNMANAINVLS